MIRPEPPKEKPVLKRCVLTVVMMCVAFGVADAEDAATTQPAAIAVTDVEAIKAKMGETITVEGTIDKAAWSNSGKVLNVSFKDAKQGLLMVVFEKNKDKFNAAFGGDVAAAWTGAKVKVTGKIEEYGGKVESMKGRPQIILVNSEQVTIVEAAPKK
jgi:DNA/RNA endonuclease YhcR with UshA esterase domain